MRCTKVIEVKSSTAKVKFEEEVCGETQLQIQTGKPSDVGRALDYPAIRAEYHDLLIAYGD